MKFCSTCNNMYYISVSDTEVDKLEYYCRNCGNKDDANDIPGTMSVSNVQLVNDVTNMSHIINKYTKLDPTIPRISNIQCPNVECPTNKDDKHKAEILYIRYDEDNLKYIYMCSTCDTTWKTNEKK